jgi:tetratricopeptide (TPR) repeat protein
MEQRFILLVMVLCWVVFSGVKAREFTASGEYGGASSCRACHESFYERWSGSAHGASVQAFSGSLAQTFAPMEGPMRAGDRSYMIELTKSGGYFKRISDAGLEKVYPIRHVVGGRNVCFFLIPLEQGRLQVAPLAYHVGSGRWSFVTEGAADHFGVGPVPSELEWTDRRFRFDSGCRDCHVGSLDPQYEAATDSYRTAWKEAGIACESCHGPVEAHRLAAEKRAAGGGALALDELKLIRFQAGLDRGQRDASCARCHAKRVSLTQDFRPGEHFFDHYDLISYENPVFSSDGRDAGESYTQTGWLANRCVESGSLECIHCHTASGGFRFREQPNQACLPCHEERVAQVTEHSHHSADSAGSRCIQCHMPKRAEGYRVRSDHSFRPPSPAASLAFGSSNGCTLCHQAGNAEQDDVWANLHVIKWHGNASQSGTLEAGRLVEAARAGQWEMLPQMIDFLDSDRCDPPTAVALLRLLASCPGDEKWGVIRRKLLDESPWVRSAAAGGLEADYSLAATDLLLQATLDEYRVVRIRAASSLLGRDLSGRPLSDRALFEGARREYWNSLVSEPDRWTSYVQQGLYFDRLGDHEKAAEAYEKAVALRDDEVQPMLNAALAYRRLGQEERAHALLSQALKVEPEHAVVHFQLAQLEAGLKRMDRCEAHLRSALKSDPDLVAAAYQLALLLGERRDEEAISWLKQVVVKEPSRWEYTASTLFYMRKLGLDDEIEGFLRTVVAHDEAAAESYVELVRIYQRQGRDEEAVALFRMMKRNRNLPKEVRRFAAQMEQQLIAE